MRRKNDINVKGCIRDWQENKNIESRDKVFFRYKDVVDSYIEKFCGRRNIHDFSIEDLKQEGYLELLNIISNININMKSPIVTVIYNEIGRRLEVVLRENYGIVIPKRFLTLIEKCEESKYYKGSFDEYPNALCFDLGCSENELSIIKSLKNVGDMVYLPYKDILEKECNEYEYIQEDIACFEKVDISCLNSIFKELLSTLTPREEKVLKLRFGFSDGRERTLEEVGKELNVNKERVRQIEAKALRKLRHPSRIIKLTGYLEDC